MSDYEFMSEEEFFLGREIVIDLYKYLKPRLAISCHLADTNLVSELDISIVAGNNDQWGIQYMCRTAEFYIKHSINYRYKVSLYKPDCYRAVGRILGAEKDPINE